MKNHNLISLKDLKQRQKEIFGYKHDDDIIVDPSSLKRAREIDTSLRVTPEFPIARLSLIKSIEREASREAQAQELKCRTFERKTCGGGLLRLFAFTQDW